MKLFDKLFHRNKPVNVNLDFPTKWETVTADQFKEICTVLSIPGIDRDKALFLILCTLTHIRPDRADKYDEKVLRHGQPFIINGQAHIIRSADIAEACRQLGFIYDTIGPAPSPFQDVDRLLYGVSFRAFYEADSFILRYGTEPNGAYLKTAVKSLTGGRVRKLLPWQRTATIIWWNGMKQDLMAMYPYVLKQGESITTKTQAQILQDILSSLNQDRPQDNDKILQTDVHSVLHTLNKIYHDADKRLSK